MPVGLKQGPHRIALALLAVALVLILLLAHRGSHANTAHPAATSTALEGAPLPLGAPSPSFTLRDQSGRAVALDETGGRVTVLAFLYARCGATCVVLADQIRGALDQLHRLPRVLIVSADPRGDDASVRRFLAQVGLSARASWLTGSPALLRRVWRAFGVTPASAGAAAFARTATVSLLDARWRRRDLFQQEQLTPEALAHDVGVLAGG